MVWIPCLRRNGPLPAHPGCLSKHVKECDAMSRVIRAPGLGPLVSSRSPEPVLWFDNTAYRVMQSAEFAGVDLMLQLRYAEDFELSLGVVTYRSSVYPAISILLFSPDVLPKSYFGITVRDSTDYTLKRCFKASHFPLILLSVLVPSALRRRISSTMECSSSHAPASAVSGEVIFKVQGTLAFVRQPSPTLQKAPVQRCCPAASAFSSRHAAFALLVRDESMFFMDVFCACGNALLFRLALSKSWWR